MTRALRLSARALLLCIFLAALFAGSLAPAPYDRQFRAQPNAVPSPQFLLGTDSLGRDRFSRLLYGTRISLLLAPAAAAFSLAIALLAGASAALAGGLWDRLITGATNLFLSLPWLFLFLTVRALLPLNAAPLASIAITFALMGALGWAAGARVIRAAVLNLASASFPLYARAAGLSPTRIWLRHLLPHLNTVLLAQFWLSLPAFVLGEASLGLLGLGVSEPLPSWGNLLKDLEAAPSWTEFWVWTPALLLSFVVILFQLSRPEPATSPQ